MSCIVGLVFYHMRCFVHAVLLSTPDCIRCSTYRWRSFFLYYFHCFVKYVVVIIWSLVMFSAGYCTLAVFQDLWKWCQHEWMTPKHYSLAILHRNSKTLTNCTYTILYAFKQGFYCLCGSDVLYSFVSFFSATTITHEPLHPVWWNFARTYILTTARTLLNFKVKFIFPLVDQSSPNCFGRTCKKS